MSFFGLFGDDEPAVGEDNWKTNDGWDYDFSGKPDAYAGFEADYNDNGILDDRSYDAYAGYDPTPPEAPGGGSSMFKSLTSPGVLGAAITSGAALFGGLSQMDAQKAQLKAVQEQQKMNQLLELAKLKYQLMGKGAGGGGRGRGASGPKGPTEQEINAQYSNNLSSGYGALGNNLSSIYRG